MTLLIAYGVGTSAGMTAATLFCMAIVLHIFRRGRVAAPRSTLRLYFIDETTDDNYNRDLLVWAGTPATALTCWREYFELEDELPARLFEVVDPSPRPGAISWNSNTGMTLIAARI